MKAKKILIIPFVLISNLIYSQTNLKNYLNTGFGLYAPFNSSADESSMGNSATLNLEAELSKHSTARFSIDTYRIPLSKEINFNNSIIKSDSKANITSLGLDYGLYYTSNKWRFYTFAGGSICFIEEPQFTSTNSSLLTVESKNATRWAIRISPGIKYSFSDSFVLFTELQGLSIFYKNRDNNNLLNGGGLIFGIATKI